MVTASHNSLLEVVLHRRSSDNYSRLSARLEFRFGHRGIVGPPSHNPSSGCRAPNRGRCLLFASCVILLVCRGLDYGHVFWSSCVVGHLVFLVILSLVILGFWSSCVVGHLVLLVILGFWSTCVFGHLVCFGHLGFWPCWVLAMLGLWFWPCAPPRIPHISPPI